MGITEVWAKVEDALPDGWTVQSLRCASTGLAADRRSDDWVAVAEHLDGREIRSRSGDPEAALLGLPQRARDRDRRRWSEIKRRKGAPRRET